jgi:tRNA A-37 threonylcarbamoyl transferase component Bud32
LWADGPSCWPCVKCQAIHPWRSRLGFRARLRAAAAINSSQGRRIEPVPRVQWRLIVSEPALKSAILVDKGFCSDVFAWGEGRALKLYHRGTLPARVEREFAATRAVHTAGIPAPAAFEMVEVDGRHGIVFERIDGVSLLGYTQARPWAIFEAIHLLAELHARIHRCVAPAGLPTQRSRLAAVIDAADLPTAQKRAAQDRLLTLPDGGALCHGDFHPANVLVTPRGPVVIDWGSASVGAPLGDVACTSRLIRTASLPPWSPKDAHLLLHYLRSWMHRSYLKRYFELQEGNRQQLASWEVPLAVATRSRQALTHRSQAVTQ